MAFERPVVIRRNGLVVIADKAEQAAAEELARAGGPARDRLKLLGLTSRRAGRRLLLRLAEPDAALARRRPRARPACASSPPPVHLDHEKTWTRDVGVLGPALAGNESWTPQMLAHELTHAYTTAGSRREARADPARGGAGDRGGGRPHVPAAARRPGRRGVELPAREGAAGEEPVEGQRDRQSAAGIPGGRLAGPVRDGPLGPAPPQGVRARRERLRSDRQGARRRGAAEPGCELGRAALGWESYVQTLP